jgi:hypothetical protein
MSGARGLASGPALDSSICARRLAAFSTRAAASLGSFVDCANSRAVAASRKKYHLPITVTFPVASQRQRHYAGSRGFVPAESTKVNNFFPRPLRLPRNERGAAVMFSWCWPSLSLRQAIGSGPHRGCRPFDYAGGPTSEASVSLT